MRFTAAIQIGSLQDIISVAYSGEIFPVAPGEALARMATPHPTSEFAEDQTKALRVKAGASHVVLPVPRRPNKKNDRSGN